MADTDARSRLIEAYDRMMERVKHGLDVAEQKAVPPVEHLVQAARERAVQLGEVTREEADKVGEYLMRDLHELADHVNQAGKDLRTWFHMDMELVEARLVEMMGTVADKTRVELTRLAEEASVYHTGEVSGPGILECTACGEHLRFTETGHIPPCPKCNATTFVRVTG